MTQLRTGPYFFASNYGLAKGASAITYWSQYAEPPVWESQLGVKAQQLQFNE